MHNFIYIIILLILSSCTSLATSTAALFVSLHSNKLERDTRRYKGIDECVLKKNIEAYALAESIFYGQSLPSKYQYILNPENKKIKPISSKKISYAYFIIADRIGDKRASAKLNALNVYFDKNQNDEITKFINYKYLQSHLTKCFKVPQEYKIQKTTRL